MLTSLPLYLVLYCTLDFPEIDVYLIPSFCRAWIFTLPLLPCKNIVFCFWLLLIFLHRNEDRGPNSGDSELSQKSFFFVNNYSFLLKEHFYIPHWPLVPDVLETFIVSLTIPPSYDLFDFPFDFSRFSHFILTVFVLYGQILLLSVANSWGYQLNVYIWQNWYICIYFCYSNISERSELPSVATTSSPVLALKSVGAEQ